MEKVLIILFLNCFTLTALSGQALYTPADVEVWQSKFDFLPQKEMPQSQLIIKVGKSFLGTPYEARTLEKGKDEKLVVYLKGLDCTTFLENTLAIAYLHNSPDSSFDAYTKALQHIRYRQGILTNYPSRLHYFSDWLQDNEKKGLIEIVTKQLGGKPYTKAINFMSTHRNAYPALADNGFYEDIKKTEEAINSQPHYYIPKAQIPQIEKGLKDGDIIAITTSINGLDVVHVGFAVWQKGRVHLLHASTQEKKVVLSDKPLAEYLLSNKNQSGIMVARVKE